MLSRDNSKQVHDQSDLMARALAQRREGVRREAETVAGRMIKRLRTKNAAVDEARNRQRDIHRSYFWQEVEAAILRA